MTRAQDDGRAAGCVAIDSRHEGRDARRFSHGAMATVFEVHVSHPDAGYAEQAAHAAFDLTDRLEHLLSRFVPNSDIARINLLAGGESTHVAPSTLECLAIARHLFDLTAGAFDVSIGTGLPFLDLDPDAFSVRSNRSGVQLDLGGIGKGYAIDLMVELLAEWGLERAVVHGGFSSVFALGAPEGTDGWPLTLTDPIAPTRGLARLSLCQRAISGSGRQKGAHIVDARGGEGGRGRLAAWAALSHPRALKGEALGDEGPRIRTTALTDALATAFMLLSTEEIAALCQNSRGLEAWVLQESGASRPSDSHVLHFGGADEPAL